MVMQHAPATIEFSGSANDKDVAQRVFDLMLAHGRFMSTDASIKVSLDSLAAFLGQDGAPADAAAVRGAIDANPAVFTIEEIDGAEIVATTRGGTVHAGARPGSSHTFAKRFMTPLPKPEQPPVPTRDRARVDPSWASLPSVLDGLEGYEDDDELIADGLVVELTDAAVATPPAMADIVVVEDVAEDAEVADVAVAEGFEELIETRAPERETPIARTITLPVAPSTDVAGVDDLELASAIGDRLRLDPRVANFGTQWMMEDRVPRFSRGDLRRMKDYIQEQEQPLTDDVLVQDVLAIRPGTPDFDLMRFAVNFRLSREHREFDFVGTSNQRFWSTSNLPQIGTTRRKPNEIGSDYRYLLDEATEDVGPQAATSLDHTLTFFEYHHGLLPYDRRLQALLPGPLLAGQKTAVLTFESPQSYTTYLVELRYPTPNRGGFVLGLDDLYTENLVPGAIISISRTENDGHYLVEYIKEPNQQGRLLEMDERRAQRYVFRPTTFACGVDPQLLLTEERFSRMAADKPLEEKVRRRPESVVAATFERVGQQREGNFWAPFADLFAAANVERPFADAGLRAILDHDDTGAFSRDPDGGDAYTYVPGTTP